MRRISWSQVQVCALRGLLSVVPLVDDCSPSLEVVAAPGPDVEFERARRIKGRSPLSMPRAERAALALLGLSKLPVPDNADCPDVVCWDGVRSIDMLGVGAVECGFGTDRYDVEEDAEDTVPIVEGGMVERLEVVESCCSPIGYDRSRALALGVP